VNHKPVQERALCRLELFVVEGKEPEVEEPGVFFIFSLISCAFLA